MLVLEKTPYNFAISVLVITVIVYSIAVYMSPNRYLWYLPTPYMLYPDSKTESDVILEATKTRTKEDIEFHKFIDISVTNAFEKIVPVSKDKLKSMATAHYGVVMGLKMIFNRPRPEQVNPNIKPLASETASTPSYPAGHAFQAYYLAKKLGEMYPEKQEELDALAKRCDDVRVSAGLHYPSDGAFSKIMIDHIA